MIYEILHILTEQVNLHLERSGLERSLVLDHIGQVDHSNETSSMTDKVVCSLINLNEEKTLKNLPNEYIEPTRVIYKNPIIHLNLFILFAANRNNYANSLVDLSSIIEFFQSKKVFTQNNTIYDRDNVGLSRIENFKVHVDLYTPSFEELNFIWGTLGGKQYPSALYKLSMIEIEHTETQRIGGLIYEIESSKKLIP